MVTTRTGEKNAEYNPRKRKRGDAEEENEAADRRSGGVSSRAANSDRDAERDNRIAVLEATNAALRTENAGFRTARDAMDARLQELEANNARLTGELQAARAALAGGRGAHQDGRGSVAPEASQPDARNAVPARPERRDYYAEAVAMRHPPAETNQAAKNEFYRRGGEQRNGVWQAKPGAPMRRFQEWDPVEPFVRDATPPAEARHQNVDMTRQPRRMYFDVNYNDRDIAQNDYGLIEEPRAGSSWENVQAGRVNKAPYHYYSEDREVQARALERWSRLDTTEGNKVPPPGRYDPRRQGGHGR